MFYWIVSGGVTVKHHFHLFHLQLKNHLNKYTRLHALFPPYSQEQQRSYLLHIISQNPREMAIRIIF